MRILLASILVCATARTAAADAPPDLLVMPDLEADSSVRVRFGSASVDGVRERGSGLAAHTVLLSAVRIAHAPRDDLELSLAVPAAVLASNDYDTALSIDGSLGVPAFGVEWTRPAGARFRFGVGALAAFGGVDRSRERAPHPGDVAAGAFFTDPEVPWSGAHMGLVHGGAGWSDGATTVRADVGVQAHAGGVLPELVPILRVSGGVARRVGDRWSASLEVLVESDVAHEGVADDTDIIPALTAGLRRRGEWDLGLGLARAWTQAESGAAEAGLSVLVDLSRKY
jgi:hypothetical protein